jgi:hypothetical protein
VLFAAGVAMFGGTQHLYRINSRDELMTLGRQRMANRVVSAYTLMQLGLAMHNHNAQRSRFPPGHTADRWGRAMHGWQAQLLPFVEQEQLHALIDFDRPWDDLTNRSVFIQSVPVYTSPYLGTEHDADGYSLSHYAGNRHVLPGGKRGLRISDFRDGVTNTILFGEVSAGFRPWGHPLNLRDPARGLRSAADAFGGPWAGGVTQFMMADGSVRVIKPTASPAALRALATPAGGDHIPGRDWADAFDEGERP